MPKETDHQNDSYKIDRRVECGEDRLPGATLHSRKIVKNISSKLYRSCFQCTIFLQLIFSLLSLKRKVRLMRSPVCVSVCLCIPPNNFLTNCYIFMKFSREDAIEGDLDAILFNSVTSTIPKWRTFKLLRWMQNLHQSAWEHEILYTDRSSKDEQLSIRPFLLETKNTNMVTI
jgi:hypothetical protein